MEEVRFEFYVVNWDINRNDVEMFNIFRNIHVNEWANKAVKKYLRKGYTREEFVKELDGIIMWQEWGRVEYEISVGDAFEDDPKKFKKIDCYYQAHANIELIADYVVSKYKEAVKKDKQAKKKEKELRVAPDVPLTKEEVRAEA